MSQDQQPQPFEPDVAAIERAITTLAWTAARAGGRTFTGKPLPTPDLRARIEDPVRYALMRAEADLTLHLHGVAGPEHAAAFSRRLNADLFEHFDRPAVAASGPEQ